jgi:hypothetical protein
LGTSPHPLSHGEVIRNGCEEEGREEEGTKKKAAKKKK